MVDEGWREVVEHGWRKVVEQGWMRRAEEEDLRRRGSEKVEEGLLRRGGFPQCFWGRWKRERERGWRVESGQWRKRGVKGCEKPWERGVRWRGEGG